MNKDLFSVVIAVFLGLNIVGPPEASALSLVVEDVTGELVGAKNVLVGSDLFDVTISGGVPCTALYTGCDDPTDFPFTNALQATSASTALLDFFSSSPAVSAALDLGIKGACNLGTVTCNIHTPYGISPTPDHVLTSQLRLSLGVNGSQVGTGFYSAQVSGRWPMFDRHM